MEQLKHKARLEQRLTTGPLPSAPDGPRLESFDALALAQGIEQEIARGVERGWDKITLHMDFKDAFLLASCLRRRAG